MLRTQTRFRWRSDDGTQTSASWKAAEDTDIVADRDTNVRLRCQVAATGDTPATAYTLYYRKVGDTEWAPVPVQKLPGLTPMPPQSAAICWDEFEPGDPRIDDVVDYYGHPGGLVTVGRTNYAAQHFQDVAAAGGCVLVYLDPMVFTDYGRYHNLLFGSVLGVPDEALWGEQVPLWPGDWCVNTVGFGGGPLFLVDFRVGSVIQSKLESVLETMVAENPHIGGFFMDDVGTRSWFPDLAWTPVTGVGPEFPTPDKNEYRAGAIELARTTRRVADKYGLVVLVNGTWGAHNTPEFPLAYNGGGYPDPTRAGCSLADIAFVEHHPIANLPYFHDYVSDSQWASESGSCAGTAFQWVVSEDDEARDAFIADGAFSFVATQPTGTYDTPPIPYSELHPTGLPSQVGTPKPVVISISSHIRNGGGGTTRQLTVP